MNSTTSASFSDITKEQTYYNKSIWVSGTSASLDEILDAREEHWHLQQELISQYHQTLICLTLNIPGPLKLFPLARLTFEEGISAIETELAHHQCEPVYSRKFFKFTGCCGYFVVSACASDCKKWMTSLEEVHPLGRIFDIDIVNTNSHKISRKEIGISERSCLLCNRPAFLCGRSRTHSVQELLDQEIVWMNSYFTKKIARQLAGLFTKAMTYEVTVTPKPGLVDRWHSGAHHDMDIDLFMDSIDALFPYFEECSICGATFTSENYKKLFDTLRALGRQAEQSMYTATRNVNTHKGLVFSGGILCAAAAHSYIQKLKFDFEFMSAICRQMLVSLHNDFETSHQTIPLTHGKQLYQTHGLRGIRGEAMNGFPTLFKIGLNIFFSCRSLNFPLYKSGRITLLYLIAYSEDTNIIKRSSYETWQNLTAQLKSFLDCTPLSEINDMQIISELDTWFLQQNISPGGSADLLALVYFLYFLSLDIISPAK